MHKIIFILLLPLLLLSKNYVISYFPLETNIVSKIGQSEIKTREISTKYLDTFINLSPIETSKLSNAVIYFHFGLDVEKKYAEVLLNQNPNLMVVDLSLNTNRINNNPYIWMDPFNMRIIAKTIYDAFVRIDKAHEHYYKINYEKFLDEIDQTFLKIREKLNTADIQSIYILDNYWEYFTNRFRITTYYREKQYLSISDISQVNEFIKNKSINKLLFYENNSNYDLVISVAKNLNLKVIEDDIFGDIWHLNLLNLSQKLSD